MSNPQGTELAQIVCWKRRPATVGLNELKQLATAVTWFWELLAYIAVARAAPLRWVAVVSDLCPFLHPDGAGTVVIKRGSQASFFHVEVAAAVKNATVQLVTSSTG